MSAADLVVTCGATLEPLEKAANAAWWNAQTDAREETERLRSEADLALSDALADADVFADVRAAQS